MHRKRDEFRRDLPRPPRATHENYVSALIEVEKALDEAYRVAPDDDQQAFVDELREQVQPAMRDGIENLSEGDRDE